MSKKIECIERLLHLNIAYQEIVEWLISNKFCDAMAAGQPTRDRERAEFVYKILKEQEKLDKIMLLYFEWSLLPKETIRITCVTTSEEKLFTYGL